MLLLFIAIAVFSFLASSCTTCSQSGRLAEQSQLHAERVVILDSKYVDQTTGLTNYKVKRIDFNNVVEFKYIESGYDINDTVIVHFNDNDFRY